MRELNKQLSTFCGTMLLIVSCAPLSSDGESSLLGSLGPFLPFALIVLLFYFLIIRPQKKQKNARDDMLSSLKKGNSILTNGGILGKIVDILGDDVLVIEVSKGNNIKIKREFINSVYDSNNKKNKN